MNPFADMVTIGQVVKPQGRRGEVAVTPLSDRPDRFPTLKAVWAGPRGGDAGRLYTVESCWPHQGRFVLKLQGVDSIDDAETLRGLDLRIGEDALAALPAGEFYHHQLLGLEAVDEAGTALGQVAEIVETGAVPVLAIRGQGPECLIPLAESFVREVDLAGHRMVIRLHGADEVAR